ncbi:hypothetical protein R1479_03903 [Ralstonia mannitolilytica]|nr:hypothetical protein R1479_03903 [Ralstonia mannitolilytica]
MPRPTDTRIAMTDDERAIRNVVDTWITASKSGDVATVLDLMTDDVLFLTPGQPPFGKDAFAKMSGDMKDVHIDGTSDIQEVQVFGEVAYLRNFLRISMTMPDGKTVRRSGYTLTILRKGADGKWRLSRDANLVLQ